MPRPAAECSCKCHSELPETVDYELLSDEELEAYEDAEDERRENRKCPCVADYARPCWKARRRRKECLRCGSNNFMTEWLGTYFCCRPDLPRCSGTTLKGYRCQLEGSEQSSDSLYYCGYHLPELPHDDLKQLVYEVGDGLILRDRIGRLGQVQFRIVKVAAPNTDVVSWCRPKDILREVGKMRKNK